MLQSDKGHVMVEPMLGFASHFDELKRKPNRLSGCLISMMTIVIGLQLVQLVLLALIWVGFDHGLLVWRR